MKIKFLDLSKEDAQISGKIFSEMKKSILQSHFILGEGVKKFEKDFADFVGTKYCIGVASGTDAILLSLRALGVGKGDEVIVSPMTFIASVSPIVMLGATPVFADINPVTYTIDPEKVEKAITKKTKAIIAVDLYGMPCDFKALQKIAKKYNVKILEDASQAHGSVYNKKMAGAFGDIAAFSFYPSKNLGAYGDAGAITTNNASLAKNISLLRNHGQDKKYNHSIIGYNSRLDAIQATILDIKLSKVKQKLKKRMQLAHLYDSLLKSLPVITPKNQKYAISNNYLYTISIKNRDSLMLFLSKHGVETVIHYPKPLHLQKAFQFLGYKKGNFSVSENLAKTCLSLPLSSINTKQEIQYIADLIKAFFSKK